MYGNNNSKSKGGFPDPLASKKEKEAKEYGLRYAKAIQSQWASGSEGSSLLKRRRDMFLKNRSYARGTQDTSIYRSLLTSLDPNNGDGSFLNLDFTPVPILPKFVRIVVNKILSKEPYPNLEAVDPLSSSEKDREKKKMEALIEQKKQLQQIKETTGVDVANVDTIPDTLEEAEIFFGQNIKTAAEIAAQIGTNLTLKWNNFNDGTYRRNVKDIVVDGMAVVKRENDPSYGIVTNYVDPIDFIHNDVQDPGFSDLIYAGHIRRMPIQELKRLAGDAFTEDQYKEIARTAQKKYGYNSSNAYSSNYDSKTKRVSFGYDEFIIEVLDFEFKAVDTMTFEEKTSRHGNVGFYDKPEGYTVSEAAAATRTVKTMENATVYGGCYIMGTDMIFNYGEKHNLPKNIHDLSRVELSYSAVAVNIENMIPKSMTNSCIGFADQLQLTHLKIQQSVAKAKPDGIMIDIEGLENVQLGKGGELQPLELHDIYEQTGVFYYRSKNPEGGHQNAPIHPIPNSIRNINEFIGLYNHYLRMIRDATGVNEVMDASSPKGDALVGVQQQALAAANNAIYDMTFSSMILFKKVCADIVKCLQVLSPDSVVYKAYANAIGEANMEVLSSFSDLPMYNFGVTVVKEMEDAEKAYLEQNIQISLAQKELDIEDAIAIRQLKDVNQAERLLVLKRKKRILQQQQMSQQNSQMQAQVQAQSAQAASQARQQEMQMEAQIKSQQMQMEAQLELQLEAAKHEMRKEIELIRAQATLGFKADDQEFKEKLEVLKEDRKDERVTKQAVEQSKLISQRQGSRGELKGSDSTSKELTEQIIKDITSE